MSNANVEITEDGFDDFGRRAKGRSDDKRAKEAAALARLEANYGFLLNPDALNEGVNGTGAKKEDNVQHTDNNSRDSTHDMSSKRGTTDVNSSSTTRKRSRSRDRSPHQRQDRHRHKDNTDHDYDRDRTHRDRDRGGDRDLTRDYRNGNNDRNDSRGDTHRNNHHEASDRSRDRTDKDRFREMDRDRDRDKPRGSNHVESRHHSSNTISSSRDDHYHRRDSGSDRR